MKRIVACAVGLSLVALIASGSLAQTPDEIKQAERDVPLLLGLLDVQPGMTVADVGAGAGAMTLIASQQLGDASHVYATDLNPRTVAELHALAEREHLANVEVVQGAEAITNLPPQCCDAIWLRDVYHHFGNAAAMNRSLATALKPGGRLAVIDFEPAPHSKLPDGVPANRGGHGIPPAIVVEEVSASGLTAVRTDLHWPEANSAYFLALFRKDK